jgi:hypothetical protein
LAEADGLSGDADAAALVVGPGAAASELFAVDTLDVVAGFAEPAPPGPTGPSVSVPPTFGSEEPEPLHAAAARIKLVRL